MMVVGILSCVCLVLMFSLGKIKILVTYVHNFWRVLLVLKISLNEIPLEILSKYPPSTLLSLACMCVGLFAQRALQNGRSHVALPCFHHWVHGRLHCVQRTLAGIKLHVWRFLLIFRLCCRLFHCLLPGFSFY